MIKEKLSFCLLRDASYYVGDSHKQWYSVHSETDPLLLGCLFVPLDGLLFRGTLFRVVAGLILNVIAVLFESYANKVRFGTFGSSFRNKSKFCVL